MLLENITSFWITSGKGGAGKTYFSTVLACDAIREGHHVLLIDSNPKNPDTLGLFRPLSDGNCYPVGETGFSYTKILSPEGKGAGAGYLVYVDPSSDRFLTLPGNGIIQLLWAVNETYGFFLDDQNFFPAINSVRIIHDTDLHLANLYFTDDQAGGWKPSFKIEQLQWLTGVRTYLCFIWTVAAMRRDYELQAIGERSGWLLQNWRNLTIINVLNPIALAFDNPIIIGPGNRRIDELVGLAEDTVDRQPLTVGTFIEYAQVAQNDASRAHILRNLALMIRARRSTPTEAASVRSRDRKRPFDVIAFPSVVGDMALFTDELSLGGIVDTQEGRKRHYKRLVERMGENFEALQKQISAL